MKNNFQIKKVNTKIIILRVCDFLLFGNHLGVKLPFSGEEVGNRLIFENGGSQLGRIVLKEL
jgi:hypothetical protein